jgi:hypothetical protein
MPVKNFKFVSPGVFINEIDNSFRPRRAEAIGPVVIGRSTRGLAMQPVTVESYSDFVTNFGGTVPGFGGGDIYRDGNFQSPMYGTYAAKAFLNANVAPLTFIRLLGQQTTNSTSAGKAGWKTNSQIAATVGSNGGAYGLWVFKSASAGTALGNGMLSAVWYLDKGKISLSGTFYNGVGGAATTSSAGVLVTTNTDKLFTVEIADDTGAVTDKIKFNFDDSKETFIRKRFNTNPQVMSSGGFYPTSAEKDYWLGETFEQELRDGGVDGSTNLTSGQDLVGIILALSDGSSGNAPSNMEGQASREARAGWFIAQDQGAPA